MPKLLATATILFVFTFGYSQTKDDVDVLSAAICGSLKETKGIADSTRLDLAYGKHLPPFFKKHKVSSEAKFDSLTQMLFYRLQKNCGEFVEILHNTNRQKGDWKTVIEKPAGSVTEKVAEELTGINHYYLEPTGDKVVVTIKDGHWTEQFKDGTSSKLTFRWTSDNEFELQFVESTNISRQHFSKKGDTYHYGIFAKDKEIFSLWAHNAPLNTYSTFKMYPIR